LIIPIETLDIPWRTPMHQAIVTTVPKWAYGLVLASLFTSMAADGARAVPINSTPGAITCKVGEPGSVGGDFEGFFDPELGGLEIDLGSFDNVDCGPNNDPPEPPPPPPPELIPFSLESRPVVIVDDVALRYPGPTDLVLHGRYILHGMYGFFNNGVYGVYNLHGVYDVQGILVDGTVYNYDRYGDAHPPILIPEPTAAVLSGTALLGLLSLARTRMPVS
jgi:hypothetical protein